MAGPTGVDPAAALRITAPYSLAVAGPELSANLGQMAASGFSVGGREIMQDGASVGYVFVIELAPDAVDADFQNAITGLTAAMGVTVQPTTIGGTPAWIGSNATYSSVAYRDGKTLVAVMAPGSSDVTRSIATALIAAS